MDGGVTAIRLPGTTKRGGEAVTTVWRGRRVFVTGHTGFKGGWLSLWLHEAGARVFGYALPPGSEPNLFTAAGIDRITEGSMADIRDLAALTQALCRCRAEVIFHLAAQPLVRRSYEDPIETYSTNVMGTANVLEAVRRADSVRAVIVVTSDKCYENREWPWGYRENDALGGHDPYSSSKACAELVTRAWRRSFTGARDLRIATARAGNVIGGGDWAADRLAPDAVRAFTQGRVLSVRQPSSVRPWQHVLEPISGYVSLAERLLSGDVQLPDAFNFGPSPAHTRSVQEVADELAALWGNGAQWDIDSGSQPSETRLLLLDSTQAMSVLDWRERLDLATTLTMTVNWYKAHLAGEDMSRVTREQLRAYLDLRPAATPVAAADQRKARRASAGTGRVAIRNGDAQ